MSDALRGGSALSGLRIMLVQAAKSRSSRSRLTRPRKFMASLRVCHLLQIAFAIYILIALHLFVTKAAPPAHVMHRHPAAAREKAPRPPSHRHALRNTPPHSPRPAVAPVATAARPAQQEKFTKAVARPAEPVDEETGVRSRQLPSPGGWPYRRARPPTVLGFSIQGGVGNQIYNILEGLYLARQTRSVLLLPAVLPRSDTGEGNAGDGDVRAGNSVWDLAQLAKGTRGGAVYPYMPAACRGRIDVMYTFLRRNAREPPADTIPTEVRWAACALLTAAPRGVTPDCEGIFSRTIVLIRRQNLTAGGDPTFLGELSSLRRTPFPNKAPDEPLCVWVFGHSYDRGGSEGDEYLYSHMHFLSAHPRIAKMARRWPLDSMAVVHVRYDEEQCDVGSHDATHVCVRAHKDGHRKDPVYWAPVEKYVAVISATLKAEGVTSIYLAASPYVPEKTVRKLRKAFAKEVAVERHASAVFEDESDVNFLERELAIRSRVFIGDFGSTWSGTVYYKRRTIDKRTHWANVLLGVASNIGYYGITSPLQLPD